MKRLFVLVGFLVLVALSTASGLIYFTPQDIRRIIARKEQAVIGPTANDRLILRVSAADLIGKTARVKPIVELGTKDIANWNGINGGFALNGLLSIYDRPGRYYWVTMQLKGGSSDSFVWPKNILRIELKIKNRFVRYHGQKNWPSDRYQQKISRSASQHYGTQIKSDVLPHGYSHLGFREGS